MNRLRLKVEHSKQKKKGQQQRSRAKKQAERAAAAAAAASAAAAAEAAPRPQVFTFGSAPAASATDAFTFSVGSAGPSMPAARPAAKPAGITRPPGLAPQAKLATPDKAARGSQVFAPAFGGHVPTKEAILRAVEALTQANLTDGPDRCVPRTCVFEGVGRVNVMLYGASRGARMTEGQLGDELLMWVSTGLDEGQVRQLIEWLRSTDEDTTQLRRPARPTHPDVVGSWPPRGGSWPDREPVHRGSVPAYDRDDAWVSDV